MSNYLAIATVTATLQRLLQSAVQADVNGARVTTVRPEQLGSGTPEAGVNLFMYQTTSNPAWGNHATPGRQRRGETTKQSQTPLDLHYLLSFYGNDGELEPQRLLGSVIRTLEDKSILTSQMLRDTTNDSSFSYLAESDLADQTEMIQVLPIDLELDELTSLWSSFFQSPYILSCTYRASVILLEGEAPSRRALPVRDRQTTTAPFSIQPVIEQIISEAGRYQPIVRDSVLLIRGRNLQSPMLGVRIGGTLVTPQSVTNTHIRLPLAAVPEDSLRAGVQSLQIVHLREPNATERDALLGVEEIEGRKRDRLQTVRRASDLALRNVESNIEAFVLRPTILSVSVDDVQGSSDDPRTAQITVRSDVSIGRDQRVVLVLNNRSLSEPADYLFEGDRRSEDTHTLAFRVSEILPGDYLVRLMVDGAESLLTVDATPTSPTYEQYVGPLAVIE